MVYLQIGSVPTGRGGGAGDGEARHHRDHGEGGGKDGEHVEHGCDL